MTRNQYSPDIRAAAIADYYASGDTAKDVAARLGIPRPTLSKWVAAEADHALTGGHWMVVAGIQRWQTCFFDELADCTIHGEAA